MTQCKRREGLRRTPPAGLGPCADATTLPSCAVRRLKCLYQANAVGWLRVSNICTMSSPPPTRLRRWSMSGLFATVGILLGLFGMHVLNLHGVQHEPEGTSASTSVHMHSSALGEESATHEQDRTPDAASAQCCDHGHDMSAMALCLGLLVGVGIVIALTTARRQARPASKGAPVRGLRFVWSTARAGPPYAMAFSVIRC